MPSLTLEIAAESETEALGQRLAEHLLPGTVVALVGTLGAGKTRLVQAIATALGNARDDVTSPTYVLINEYTAGSMPVYHFDAYRLRDDDEFLELGPEEYFDSAGITFIEWGDRVAHLMPEETITIAIEVLDRDARRVQLKNLPESLYNSLKCPSLPGRD